MDDQFWYVLVCRDCGDGEDALPMPFESARDRGRWAAEHTRGTGHDRWLVVDQPRLTDGDGRVGQVLD